ncbi:ADP-ribosyl cyclase/cyclic ADP-ribose hydrolase 1-like [Notolabrus celidotus]|uniref:ADP-ribosyl cyclase/cyclic ADP-ribose hydrolase 1-like n=1 Tax=Notolabrus celidotus TaxID=1203425 RepID=UPI0014902216|nr:ADP-ribosyl cyclase/cyclic ADP-ribose hydrolase 1-like [Notolabrus celidotus]
MGLIKGLAIGGTVTIVVVVIIVVPTVLLTRQEADFQETFMEKCLKFPEEKQVCESKWAAFEQAYVGKDECNITEENYKLLFDQTPFKHPCGKTMFWSKTPDLVHKYTEKRDCLFSLEDTLLGYVLNHLKWCGKLGSKEYIGRSTDKLKTANDPRIVAKTFTENCQECKLNPVDVFWKIASTKFALHACDGASVMLDGERPEPYDSNSFFGGVEVPNLQPPRVNNLTVVLVNPENGKNCTCESLGNLRKDLDQKIGCTCRAVAKSHVEKCIKESTPCGACW